MPIRYERDDQRRLIRVTVTEPYVTEEILAALDRQAAEHTWEYAILYDLRDGAHMATESDLQRLAARTKELGVGRQRGPVGLAIGNQAGWGLMYTELVRKIVTVEVLLTEGQVDGWLARNTGDARGDG